MWLISLLTRIIPIYRWYVNLWINPWFYGWNYTIIFSPETRLQREPATTNYGHRTKKHPQSWHQKKLSKRWCFSCHRNARKWDRCVGFCMKHQTITTNILNSRYWCHCRAILSCAKGFNLEPCSESETTSWTPVFSSDSAYTFIPTFWRVISW